MKLNKIFLYGSIVLTGMLASCSSDDYEAGPVAAGNQLYAVTFGEDNILSVERDPAEPTSYAITVYRDEAKSTDALSVPLKVLSNDEGIFTVPAKVDFAAGSSEAEIVITFDKAEVGVPYSMEVALDESYINPYKSSTTTSCQIEMTRVKWNPVGTGQWYDGWCGELFEVEISQRDDVPTMYRFTNPIVDEYVQMYTDMGYPYEKGTYNPYLVFNTKDDMVTWGDYFLFNFVYSGYDEIYAFYDEELAEESAVVRNKEGGIQYLQMLPVYVLPALDYYVLDDESYCYLIFPDQDLPEALLEDEEGGDEEEDVEGGDEEGEDEEEGDEEGDDEEGEGEAAAPVRKALVRSHRLHR